MQRESLAFFKRQGWRCELAEDAAGFWRKTNHTDYDALLVAQQLSEGTTLWAKTLRQEGNKAALVLLLQDGGVAERIAALNAGYDDVVAQATHLGELKARINAIWRRQAQYPQPRLEIGPLHIQPEERLAATNGQTIPLTKKEFDLLFYLARQRGRVATKAQLVEYLWDERMEYTASYDFLYAHLKNLRRKLQRAGVRDLIVSVYGLGYKLDY
jgi:DNA-binding response OmpR family regulator